MSTKSLIAAIARLVSKTRFGKSSQRRFYRIYRDQLNAAMVFTDWVFTKEVQPLTLGLLIPGFIGASSEDAKEKALQGQKTKRL